MKPSPLKFIAIATVLGLSVSLAACEKKEESPLDKASEAVQDGLDLRKNEPIKDAAEDVKAAAEDTGAAIKEKAEDIKN